MRRPSLFVAAICLSAALLTSWVSMNLYGRFEHRAETVAQQIALIEGRVPVIDAQPFDWVPFQSRILFPALLKTASAIGVLELSEWYLILRVASAVLAFLTFALVVQRLTNAPDKLVAAAVICLALGLLPTFNHGWEQPTDYFDVFFFSLFAWFALERRPALMLAAVIAGSFNHQTTAMAGVLWMGVQARRTPAAWKREVPFGVALGAIVYVLTFLIRHALRPDAAAGYEVNGYLTLSQLQQFVAHPSPFGWPVLLVAMLAPSIAWLLANRAWWTREDGSLFVAVAAIVAASSVVAYWEELRSVFLCPLVLLVIAAARIEARQFMPMPRLPDSVPAPSSSTPA